MGEELSIIHVGRRRDRSVVSYSPWKEPMVLVQHTNTNFTISGNDTEIICTSQFPSFLGVLAGKPSIFTLSGLTCPLTILGGRKDYRALVGDEVSHVFGFGRTEIELTDRGKIQFDVDRIARDLRCDKCPVLLSLEDIAVIAFAYIIWVEL
jgi:hypothetical protein